MFRDRISLEKRRFRGAEACFDVASRRVVADIFIFAAARSGEFSRGVRDKGAIVNGC